MVHDLAAGGKARTWNHFVHHLLTGGEDAVIFMDGDAEILPGSIDALVSDLAAQPGANAAARSEARRGGKECVSTCRSRGTPYHEKKKTYTRAGGGKETK